MDTSIKSTIENSHTRTLAPLWTTHAIAAALGLPVEGNDRPITSIHTDSRDVKAGGLFIALPGQTAHGNDFVPQAIANGAAAVISTQRVETDVPQFIVPDGMAAFYTLAAAARARFKGPVIALTGSAGKTTTKEMLAAMLGAHAPVGSFNNHVGVPLTLCRLPANANAAVFELGMNNPGEITPLAKLVRPHVAMVLNVKPVHVEGLGSIEAIRLEKLSISEGLAPNGTFIVPHGLSLEGIAWRGKTLTFGETAGDITLKAYEPHGADWNVQAVVRGRVIHFTLKDGSPIRLQNALGALAAVSCLNGVDVSAAAKGLAKAGLMAGRGAAQVVNGITVIDDSFNGNPASMAAALQSLRVRPVTGRRVAVLGDMLELGADEIQYHKDLAKEVQAIDGFFCVGPLMQYFYDALPASQQWGYHADPTTFDPATIMGRLREGDAIVVKGSKKMLYVHNIVPRLIALLNQHNQTQRGQCG